MCWWKGYEHHESRQCLPTANRQEGWKMRGMLSRARQRAQSSCTWGCSPVRTLWSGVNKPASIHWEKTKNKKPHPSIHERDEKDSIFLSSLPKAQCSLFSEIYKQYVMHIGYIKTVWRKENLMAHGQCGELTLAHRLQNLGTGITCIRSSSTHTASLPLKWDARGSLPSSASNCGCEKIQIAAVILMVRAKLQELQLRNKIQGQ